jgi:hypothetical protein
MMKSFLTCIAAAIVIASILIPSGLYAQEKNEEVTIIAPYNPTVTKANKINRNPKIILTETEAIPLLDYSIRSERVNTTVTPENPKPSRVPGEVAKDLYRSHIRAGFGNYLTPYMELWVNSLQSDEFNAGAHIGYISSYGQIKDYAKSTFGTTLAEAYATKYFDEHAFTAKIDYQRKMVHRYGFMPDDFPTLDISDDSIKQVYQKIGFKAAFSSNKTADDAFNYFAALDGYYFTDKYESHETGVFFSAGLAKKMDAFNNGRSQELGIDLDIDYYLNKDSLDSHNSGIFSATPFFDMDLHPYRIFVGLKIDYLSDTVSSVNFYPIIRAEVSLLEEMLVVYAGIGGGLTKNTFEGLSEENPFINSIIPLEYSNNTFEVDGGVKGRITELLDFNISLRYANTENLPMFVTDTSNILGNTFNVIYDNAKIFGVNAEFGFRSKSDFGLLLGLGYNSYTMKDEEEAWQRPGLTASLDTYYILKEKLKLSLNLTARGSMYARTFVNQQLTPEQMNGWLDLGIGGEYSINKQFSVFANLNNLLNNGYDKWYQYPVQKFNVLAGVGFSF